MGPALISELLLIPAGIPPVLPRRQRWHFLSCSTCQTDHDEPEPVLVRAGTDPGRPAEPSPGGGHLTPLGSPAKSGRPPHVLTHLIRAARRTPSARPAHPRHPPTARRPEAAVEASFARLQGPDRVALPRRTFRRPCRAMGTNVPWARCSGRTATAIGYHAGAAQLPPDLPMATPNPNIPPEWGYSTGPDAVRRPALTPTRARYRLRPSRGSTSRSRSGELCRSGRLPPTPSTRPGTLGRAVRPGSAAGPPAGPAGTGRGRRPAACRIGGERLLHPLPGGDVQVVGRLVQHHQVGAGDHRFRQRQAHRSPALKEPTRLNTSS